jgi:hypothetical protein
MSKLWLSLQIQNLFISLISLGGINIIIIISDINLYSQASYDYVKLLFENVRILRLWRISRQSKLVSLDKSTSDINSHLSRCHLGRKAISEGDLILARLGLFCMPEMQKRDMFICAKHHAHLGQYWSKPNTCKRPQGRTQGSQNRSHIHSCNRARRLESVWGPSSHWSV